MSPNLSLVIRHDQKTRKASICMLSTNSVTSDPRIRKEAACLAKAGYQVTIIGARDEKSARTGELDGCSIIRVVTLRHLYERLVSPHKIAPQNPGRHFPLRFVSKLRADVLNIISVIWLNMALAKDAVKQNADVYHAHDLDTLLAGVFVKWWTAKKLVYDFHELFTEQFRDGIKTNVWKFFYSFLERVLIKRADLRITVCQSLGKWITQRYGVNGVITIRNIPPLQSCVVSRSRGDRIPVILYHGGYYRDRGLEQLIESMRFLKSGNLILRGYGNIEHNLRALVKEFGIEHRVRFDSPVLMNDLVKAASEADVGVIPYVPFCLNNRFCLPNKLFEYMMAGLAVAGSDLPELRNIILGLEIGTVFNPENPQAIAEALNEMISHRNRLKAMKENAWQAARQRYNWEAEGKVLLAAYQTLITNDV